VIFMQSWSRCKRQCALALPHAKSSRKKLRDFKQSSSRVRQQVQLLSKKPRRSLLVFMQSWSRRKRQAPLCMTSWKVVPVPPILLKRRLLDCEEIWNRRGQQVQLPLRKRDAQVQPLLRSLPVVKVHAAPHKRKWQGLMLNWKAKGALQKTMPQDFDMSWSRSD